MRGTAFRVTSDPALRFADAPQVHPVRRWLRAAGILLRTPAETALILRARLTGRRVRARQAMAALIGLDHRGLWLRPGETFRDATPPGAPMVPGLDPQSDLQSTRDPVRSARADVVILCDPGYELLPGAEAALCAALADHPRFQALYGDALLVRPDGAAMPLLRPAFDPDYLMALDYIGSLIAVRGAAWDAVAAETTASGPARVTDLILRLAERDGPGAIGHLPRPLARVALVNPGRTAGEGGRSAHPARPITGRKVASAPHLRADADVAVAPDGAAAHRAVIRHHLDRTGAADVEAVPGPDGILTLRHPLPPQPPLVSLIVPTRDRLDLLRPCIASLLTRTAWPEREILICDNDSREPETRAYLRDLEARGLARIVPWPGPFDFAAMNNAAARAARGRVLAFVNNDVEARHPDWLERLVCEALRPEVGAVGPKLIDGRGRIQHGGVVLGPGGLVTHAHRFFPGDAPGYLGGLSATRAVSAVTAACLVVEADKFARVGGFDAAAFAVDFNDVDLCLRLGQAGYRTLFVPGAVLDHYEAASRRWTPPALARHRREVAAFKERWGPLLAQDPHYHPGFDPDLGTYARLRPDGAGAVGPR